MLMPTRKSIYKGVASISDYHALNHLRQIFGTLVFRTLIATETKMVLIMNLSLIYLIETEYIFMIMKLRI